MSRKCSPQRIFGKVGMEFMQADLGVIPDDRKKSIYPLWVRGQECVQMEIALGRKSGLVRQEANNHGVIVDRVGPQK